MKFDRKKFYDGFRAWRSFITPQQVQGLNFLLDCIESDPHIARLEWVAYMLATVKHETADTYLPIHEYGSRNYFINRYGGQTRKGKELGNDTPEEGFDYAGKGFPQTTGESNYEKSEIALRREYPALVASFEKRTGRKFDLTVGDQPNDKADPQNMLDPQIAYAVMSYGMRTGMFTDHKLSRYLNGTIKDYKGARKIINGTDKDMTIAGYAQHFERILRASLTNGFANLSDSEIDSAAASINPAPLANQETEFEKQDEPTQQPQPPTTSTEIIETTKTEEDGKTVEVKTVSTVESVPAPPVEVPQVSAETEPPTVVSGIKASVAGAITFVTTTGAGLLTWLAGAKTELIYGFFGAAVIVGIVFIWKRFDYAAKENERAHNERMERERRAHEVMMATIKAAADPNLNTVKVVPTPIQNSETAK